jgi:hypothetical protein
MWALSSLLLFYISNDVTFIFSTIVQDKEKKKNDEILGITIIFQLQKLCIIE